MFTDVISNMLLWKGEFRPCHVALTCRLTPELTRTQHEAFNPIEEGNDERELYRRRVECVGKRRT
jgi:hypothetical protein